ncbi:MAG: hypothetical protein AAFX87_28295 [Bacteroidota bacterium]
MKGSKNRIPALILSTLAIVMMMLCNGCLQLFEEGAIRPDIRPETERLVNKVWLLKEWQRSYRIITPETGDTMVIVRDEHYSFEDRLWQNSTVETTRALVFGPSDPSISATMETLLGSSSPPENGKAFNFTGRPCNIKDSEVNWGWVNIGEPVIKFFGGEMLFERWEVNRLTDDELIISGVDLYVSFNRSAGGASWEAYSDWDIFGVITENDQCATLIDTGEQLCFVGLEEYERRVRDVCPTCIFQKEAYVRFEAVTAPYCGPSEGCDEVLACENDGTFNATTCGCDCPAGFYGNLCEISPETCSDNIPCVNGTVVPNDFGDGCDCQCDEGWFGFACGETEAVVSTIAGGFQGQADGTGSNAQFNLPAGAALDNEGNLIIADVNNHRIRRMTTDGTVTTVAGSFGGYVDDVGNNARFSIPIDVAVDDQGNIYVADQNNHAIRLIDTDGQVTTLAGNGTIGIAIEGMIGAANTPSFAFPRAIALDAAQEWLYIVDNSYQIMRMRVTNQPTQRVIEIVAGVAQNNGFNDGLVRQARFAECNDIVLDPSGNIYVADARNNAVRLINQKDGIVTTIAGNPPTVQNPINLPINDIFDRVAGLAWTPNGIYLTDMRHNRIRILQPFDDGVWAVANLAGDYEFNNAGIVGNTSGFIDGLGNEARFREPYGIVADAQGDLYVIDSQNSAIRKVTIGN